MAPRFGFDDGSKSDFDTTLVLATLLISLLCETNASDQPHAAPVAQGSDTGRILSQSRHSKAAGSLLDCAHLSDQTKIWSDLSGPAARSPENNRARMAPVEENPISDSSQRTAKKNASIIPPAKEVELDIQQPDGPHNFAELHGRSDPNENLSLQHYPSNWAVPDDDDDNDDEDDELYVQSTPV